MEEVEEERVANKIKVNRHPKRRNNDLVAAMYAMYRSRNEEGRLNSMADIARVYRKTRQAVYDLFRSRGYELRAKKLAGLVVMDGISFTLTKDDHLRGSVPGKGRMHLHRYVWEKERGPVPEGFVVHHIDGDKARNSIDNLELVSKKEMHRFSGGRNQFSNNKISDDKGKEKVPADDEGPQEAGDEGEDRAD